MAYYVINDIKVTDPEGYKDYISGARPLLGSLGARYLVRGGAVTVYEGDWTPARLVIIEWPDRQAADAAYFSPEYRALKVIRTATTQSRRIGVEGLP